MKITQYSASPTHKNEFKILNQLKMPETLDYDLTDREKELIKKVIGVKEEEYVMGDEDKEEQEEEEQKQEGGKRSKYGRTRKARRFW